MPETELSNEVSATTLTFDVSNLSLAEDIPKVIASWTNNTALSEYYTIVYRNQQNRLQGADSTNRDNYNIVGAVSSSDGTEIRVSSEPNQSEPSDIQTIHNNLDGSGTSSDPYIITNDYELQSISVDTAAFYTLGIDIDASGTTDWNGGSGFNPINTFTGTLDGDGFEVFGLFVSRGGGSAALCSSLGSGGVVKNIAIKSADISGSKNGSDFGSDTIHVGGIVANNSGTIQNVELTGSVTGSLNKRRSSNANGNLDTGGLVGINSGSIIDSYAIAAVDGSIDGFKSIDSSYNNDVGGAVGENNGGTVTTSYSAGAVTGNINTGDTIGVSATNSFGGLVGENTGSVVDSYWDTEASGQTTSSGGIGLTTSEMQGASAETNMSGFDFTNSWETISADYPDLIVDKEDQTTDQYLFEDYGTDYQTSYSYITNVVTAHVFGYSDEQSTGTNVDTFDWEENWGTVNWSQEEISPLDAQDTSTLDFTVEEWDTNTWGLSWQTFENVEDEVILNKSGFKLSWSVADKGEDLHFIYRSTTPGIKKEDYELVGATKDNYFVDNGATPGEEYYYRVGYATITDEFASSNVASITTSVPIIDDDPIVTDTLSESIVGDDNSLSFDAASITTFTSTQAQLVDAAISRDTSINTDVNASIIQPLTFAASVEEGTVTPSQVSLLSQEFSSTFDGGTVETISISSVQQDAESVAFEQEIPTDAIATPTQTQETSNVLETPLLTQVNAEANESTDAIEITNAVTVVSSATATVSTVASTDESTSATDPAIKPSAEAQSSDSTEFSSNDEGGQITPSSVVSSDTPSVGFVTDGGVITATSTSNDTPSTGTAIEETGITAPILSSTVTSAETSSVSDTGTVTGEVETSVAPVSLALAQETPIPIDSQTVSVESTEFSTAGDGAATTTFSSVTREIDADSLAISSPDVATLTFSALESGEFAASIDEALIQEIAIVEIDTVDTAIVVDSGIVDAQITSVVSADEFTQEFNAGETSSIVGNTIESSESTSAEELAIPESIDAFIFTTASDGIAIPPATLQEGVASSILSAETAFAGDDALVETLAASSIEIDAFTQSFEDKDITTEKAGTILATTDSLEETSSLSDVNSTSSSVSTLTSDNGFAAATDTGTLTVEAEKSVISAEENASAIEEGTITSQSVDTLTSTEFTFSVDDAVVQTTNATSILSDDEFAQAITQPIATTVDILTAEQNAFALSSEADIIEGITSNIAESPSIGTSSTSGIQEFNASVAPIDAFTFSVDGEIQSQQIVDIEVTALTSALEEGILTAESVLTQEEDAFTLSNEFDRESPFTATIQEINAFTSAITAGFVDVDYLTKEPEDFTSSFEQGSITQVVGTAGTVAENIKFGDTAVARDAAGDEEMESLSLLQNAQSIAYEPSTNTDSAIETFEINAKSFAEEEGSVTEYVVTSFDTPSTSIAREDDRETAASFDTETITAQTTALEEGTRTETVASPIEVNAFASTVEEATITQKFGETSEAPTIGISVSQSEVTDVSSVLVDSFESIVATRNITLLTTETGTTSLTTRDPEVTRAFESSRQPNLKATPLVSPDEETSAVVKKAVLPVEMDDVVQDEFTSAGDVPLVESMLAQTFGDGQAVVNQDLDELDLTTMAATIPQAGVGINPVVSPTSALFETFESEETFVITSFLAEPRIVAFSKQEDPLDAGAVRSPSSNVDDDDSESELTTKDDTTSLSIEDLSTELEIRE